MTDTNRTFPTDAEAIEYLSQDGGATPCSRYGRTGPRCAPVAAAVARIIVHETDGGDPTANDLHHAMSQVVNDSPGPARIIVEHGATNGYDPEELLETDTIAEAISEMVDEGREPPYRQCDGCGTLDNPGGADWPDGLCPGCSPHNTEPTP